MHANHVVITGAFGGFGQSLTQQLLDKNYCVFALDKDIPQTLVNTNLIPIRCDITDQVSINHVLELIKNTTDKLTALINLAGRFDQFPLVEDHDQSFEKIVKLNLVAQQEITMAFFPLIKKGNGRIVNLSSETVLAQLPLQPYGLTKKMFDLWSTQLRMELALVGIKVITIRAGGHKTKFIDDSIDAINQIDRESMYLGLQRKTQAKALQILSTISKSPDEVASVIVQAIEAKRPRKIYNVNASLLFKTLGVLPQGVREWLIHRSLIKWI